MKNKFQLRLILFFLTHITSASAGEKLVMKNTETGKRYSFTLRNNVNFELKSDTLMYSGWKIEHCSDTSMFVSNWNYKPNAGGYVEEGERCLKEIKFRNIKFIRFENPSSPKFFPGLLMFGSGIALAASPALALDSENHFNKENFKDIVLVSSVVLAASSLVEYELVKKDINYDMKEWVITRKRKGFL